MKFEIGQEFVGRDVEQVPGGTVVVDVDTGATHTRSRTEPFIFSDEAPAAGATWRIAWLPPEQPELPDLTNPKVLATELYRVRSDAPGAELPGALVSDRWIAVANWVLERFTPKVGPGAPAGKDLRRGTRVRIAHRRENRWLSEEFVGHTGYVDQDGADVDGEYWVVLDDRGPSGNTIADWPSGNTIADFVHHEALVLA